MALVTSILRGGTNSHETTSEEANGVYTDFVSEGIVGSVGNTSGVAPATGGFAVNAQGTPDMTVAVSAGVAYVNATPTSQNNQTFRIKNSASSNVTISANSSGSTKYDWIYLKLDADKLNNPNTAGDDAATLVTSRSSSAASDDGTPPTYGYPLAVVTVANGASSITNGTIRDIRSQVALNTGSSNASDGWTSLSSATTFTTATGYNKGNKEYDLTSSADLTSVLSPGMRLKVTRAVTPPTQCLDLESGSSQYASKSSPSGITFTDDFTCEAWIKLESYTGSAQVIASRYNGTSGFQFLLLSDGTVRIQGGNGGGSNISNASSYQSIPLGRWVHVAAKLDMSAFTYTNTTSQIYIDGVEVPGSVARSGTNPTSLAQAGNLEIGSQNGGSSYFDGKISDVRVWSALRTTTQIRDNMNQQLVGNETNLVAYFKLDGDFNDSTSNANNLSASGGAAATNSDNPMNATEYAIVTKVTASTVTVFTGTDCNIPNITLSTPYYSTQDTPFGFPRDKGKWHVVLVDNTERVSPNLATNVWQAITGLTLSIPTGAWKHGYKGFLQQNAGGSASSQCHAVLEASTPANSTYSYPTTTSSYDAAAQFQGGQVYVEAPITLSSQTAYNIYTTYTQGTATVTNRFRGDLAQTIIFAECAYI